MLRMPSKCIEGRPVFLMDQLPIQPPQGLLTIGRDPAVLNYYSSGTPKETEICPLLGSLLFELSYPPKKILQDPSVLWSRGPL
jgi:hypothetical protein